MILRLKDLPILAFETKETWTDWLNINHDSSTGIWLKIAKKNSGIKTVNYQEALEVALCYGWIDGQKNSYDDKNWLQKFTQRASKSIWSKVNKEKAGELITSGLMQPAGLKAIETAKQNGQWEAAYDSQSRVTVPDDFLAELEKNPGAKVFFDSLNSSSRYSFLFRIQTAKKQETRAKRIAQFLKMLENGEKFH